MSSTISSAGNNVISSTGIGSGLDINGIVTSLTTAAGLARYSAKWKMKREGKRKAPGLMRLLFR